MQVSILETKTNLSKLIYLLKSKREDAIIITRHGKPVAQIILYQAQPVS